MKVRNRYRPLGKEPDAIFARAGRAAGDAASEEKERRDTELKEISALALSPVFRSWLKRTFRSNGGMFNDFLKTDAGQAQGMTLYYIARDLSRTEEGAALVSEIVSDHFGQTKKGSK